MTDYSIAFFGSSDALIQTVRAAAANLGIEIHMYRYALNAAIAPAIDAVEKKRLEVIMSYRGTAEILRQHLHIPVISLQNHTANRLRAVYEVRDHCTHIFMPLFAGEKLSHDLLQNIFPIKVTTAFYHSSDELKKIIFSCRERYGCDMVIAGGLGCSYAKEQGLDSYILLPELDEITSTLKNAISIASSNREKELWMRSTEAILNAVSDGIVAVDSQGKTTLCNQAATEMLSLNSSIIGMPLENYIPQLRSIHSSLGHQNFAIRDIKGNQCVVRSVPIELRSGLGGQLFSLQLVQKVISDGKIVSRAINQGNCARYTVNNYIHQSTQIDELLTHLKVYAASDLTVLITGESGTGKEILAHALHNESTRWDKPFVSVNCAAIPEQLMESELFGYEGGAFTGSRKNGRIGLLETADGGTVFLDEINSLPTNVQLLLLRTLQEKEIRRVGGETVIPLDVRVVAATNRNLIDEVRNGRMREDFFFRINVLSLPIPPLRERPEDIPPLVNHFASKSCKRRHIPAFVIPPECLEQLQRMPWPGNVRELKHFVARLVLLSNGSFNRSVFDTLCAENRLWGESLKLHKDAEPRKTHTPVDSENGMSWTRAKVQEALQEAHYRKGKAAKILGISRTTLWRLMQRFKL